VRDSSASLSPLQLQGELVYFEGSQARTANRDAHDHRRDGRQALNRAESLSENLFARCISQAVHKNWTGKNFRSQTAGYGKDCQTTMAEAISLAKDLNDMHALAVALWLSGFLFHFESNPAEVDFARETRGSDLRGIGQTESERVSTTQSPAISLVKPSFVRTRERPVPKQGRRLRSFLSICRYLPSRLFLHRPGTGHA
jgi:hypothetical protein